MSDTEVDPSPPHDDKTTCPPESGCVICWPEMTDGGPMRSVPTRFNVVHYTNDRLYIGDDDFHWDALLRVNGDFESDAEKLRYAQAIAKVLSEHESEIPFRPLI